MTTSAQPTAQPPAATPARPRTLRRRLRRTVRRVGAVVGLGWVRLELAVLQRVAPGVADRKALDAWCTLPPGAAARRHDHRPGPGDVVRLEVADGRTVAAEVWGEGPVVYLQHGWGGWRGQLGALVAPLVDAGYRVVAVDAPGHGDADPGMLGPRRGTIIEMIAALHAAGREFGPAAGVVAHSLGTTVAARAIREGLPVERLVLVAPNPSFDWIVDHFARTLGLRERAKAHLRSAIEDITSLRISDFDLVPLGADGAMPTTLVVHDHDDAEVPYAIGAELADAWPDARLVSTRRLGHYRILGSPEVAAAAVEHVTASPPANDPA